MKLTKKQLNNLIKEAWYHYVSPRALTKKGREEIGKEVEAIEEKEIADVANKYGISSFALQGKIWEYPKGTNLEKIARDLQAKEQSYGQASMPVQKPLKVEPSMPDKKISATFSEIRALEVIVKGANARKKRDLNLGEKLAMSKTLDMLKDGGRSSAWIDTALRQYDSLGDAGFDKITNEGSEMKITRKSLRKIVRESLEQPSTSEQEIADMVDFYLSEKGQFAWRMARTDFYDMADGGDAGGVREKYYSHWKDEDFERVIDKVED